jgi:hypothetical protein
MSDRNLDQQPKRPTSSAVDGRNHHFTATNDRKNRLTASIASILNSPSTTAVSKRILILVEVRSSTECFASASNHDHPYAVILIELGEGPNHVRTHEAEVSPGIHVVGSVQGDDGDTAVFRVPVDLDVRELELNMFVSRVLRSGRD